MKILCLIFRFILFIFGLSAKTDKSNQNGEYCNMAEIEEGTKKRLKVVLKTASGNPARYQVGSEIWASSDETVVSVTPVEGDPLQADVEGLDGSNNEPVVISFQCDGDPDDNETRTIVATKSYVCTQGEAMVVELEEVETGTEATGAELEETETSAGGSETEDES